MRSGELAPVFKVERHESIVVQIWREVLVAKVTLGCEGDDAIDDANTAIEAFMKSFKE